MKNKKFKIAIIIIICFIAIGLSIYYTLQYIQNKQQENMKEYTPQQEISDEQLRKTIVSLYFKSPDNTNLIPEARLIDAKLLIEQPYQKLLQMLIEGPKNQNLVATIPTGTKLNGVEFTKGELKVNLSEEFVKNQTGTEQEKKASIYSIVNTVTELNEVNSVRILINGEEGKGFENSKIDFKQAFVREENIIEE